MTDRRQFHQTVAATAAALALEGKLPDAASAGPASPPPDPLPAGAAARLGSSRLWHLWPASNSGLNDLAFSPDGRYLATLGYQDDHVFIWSIPDGRAVRDWEPQEVDRGGSLLWTEQGLYVASNGGVSLWEPLTAALIHRFTDEAAEGLARSPDERWLAATSWYRGTVELWDTTTYQPVAQFFAEINGERRVFPNQGDILLSIAFSRCGRWLAAGGYSNDQMLPTAGLVHCWDIAARRHLVRFLTRGCPVGRLVFAPTGRLLTADWAGSFAHWEPTEGRLLRDWPRPRTGNVYHSLAANAGGQIALQREDGVYLWHPDPAPEALLCPARGYCHLAYSHDGRFVAVAGRSGRVDLYDAATGADVSPPDRQASHVGRIELTADGTICLAWLGYGGPHHPNEFVLRDTRTGTRLGAKPPADWRPLALAPAGTRVAGLLHESQLAVWDWASGAVQVRPEVNPRIVAWHPDGQALIAATEGQVVSWHPASGRGQGQPVSCAVPLVGLGVAAGGRAAALNEKGDLFVWQVDQVDWPRRLAIPPRPSQARFYPAPDPLALSPDGLSVAVTRGDGIVYAGSLAGTDLRPVYTHPRGDTSQDANSVILRYTSAGRLLIAGTCTALRDHDWWYTGVVADGGSGEVVWRSPPQRFSAWALALAPDGKALLTGQEDGTLLVWPLGAGSGPARSDDKTSGLRSP